MKMTRFRAFVMTALAALLAQCTPHAGAAEPTFRYLAEATLPELECADWESTGSRGIVAVGKPSNVIQFLTPGGPWTDDDAIVRDEFGNVLVDLRGTTWVQLPVVHITDSGAERIRMVFWQVEDLDGDGEPDLPTAGMTAPTGPDGDVMNVVEVRISQISSTDSWNPNRFYISPNGSLRFCIAIGRFRK